jgi:Tfp pilus assembly protein PilF
MKVRSKLFCLILSVLCVTGAAFAQTQNTDPELNRLRHEFAMRFFEPGSHMALAKYFREKGDSLQAFYILEYARRYRFEQKDFDAAYLLHFGGFRPLDNSKAEEEKYLALRKGDPDNVAAIIHLADIYVSRADFISAEPLFKLVLEKDPENFTAVGALAEIYRRRNIPEKAKTILAEFERKYPNAAATYNMRIHRIMDTDAAAAKKLIDEALAKHPEEGQLWFYKAVLADREKKIQEAEGYFVKAAELAKNSVEVQGYTAAFFRVEKRDIDTALKYYLNTYFLDPHAHIDGFAEAKIWSLNYENSKARVQKLLTAGTKPEDLLEDSNPVIVSITLDHLSKKWDGKNRELFVRMMRHDDTGVRWMAMKTLDANEGATFDGRLKELLDDSNLRVRGLAAYMAVRRWKQGSFPEMRKMLAEDAQILRFDAVSALMMEGGPVGRTIVIEHRKKEPSEYLRKLIDSSLSKSSDELIQK